MRSRAALLTGSLAVAALALTGCGGDDASAGPGAMVESGVTAMQQADVLACDTDRDVLTQAVDAYTMLEGGPPPSEAALVPDYLREESELWDLDATGVPTPAPSSPC